MPRLSLQEEICIGCGICELICSYQHLGVFNPKRARIKLNRTDRSLSLPTFCIQCEGRPCCEACPTGALQVGSMGEVTLNPTDCTECGLCSEACKFDGVFLDTVSAKPLICDLCSGEPLCIKYCPAQALILSSAQ